MSVIWTSFLPTIGEKKRMKPNNGRQAIRTPGLAHAKRALYQLS